MEDVERQNDSQNARGQPPAGRTSRKPPGHDEIEAAFRNDPLFPAIHIGKRTYRDKRTREERVNGPYWAEYFTHGRQYQESLKTSNKAVVLRRAYALAERLERGQQSVRDSRRTIQELCLMPTKPPARSWGGRRRRS